MLNPIPIQYLALLAYFILRFGVGIILLHIALRVWRERTSFAVLLPGTSGRFIVAPLVAGKVVIALFLLLGWHTQYAAIVLALMSLDLMLTRRWLAHPTLPSRAFYVLCFFVSLSLLITGAGAFAVDLPI